MANPPPPKMPAPPKKPTAAWRLKLGKAIPWVLALTVSMFLVQVYLAGVGLFADAAYLETHGFFGDLVFHLLPLVIAVVGFVGADWRIGVVGVVLMVQMELQYAFMGSLDGFIQALHPVNGVAMMALTTGALMTRLPWAPQRPARAPAPKA